jgi:hypothetical protein
MASNSNRIEGKVQIFKDFTSLLSYTRELVAQEPLVVKEKTLTYLSLRAPKLWNKSAIGLIVVLARLEAQLANLSLQHNKWLEVDLIDSEAIKTIKSITQACSGLTTQISILTTRLGVSEAQLHGSAMRHERTNNNSVEVAELAFSAVEDHDAPLATNLEEAKAKAKAYLESIN